jgi:signal transduction histidine kinase
VGRLFWKFFAVFWLAQVVSSVGVGVTIWLLRPDHPRQVTSAQGEATAAGPARPGAEQPRVPPPRPAPHRRLPLPPPLMPLIAGAFVSLLFAALLAWYFAQPIRSLRGAFDAVAGGDLGRRVAGEMSVRKDELADLGRDFDRMAERLQALIESQRRLLHDVSHELRSPLARLQAAGDLMTQQPERAAELVDRIRRETERMDRLVGELLTLARLDAGMIGETAVEFDLREMLDDIAEDARFEAQAKACAVALQAPDGVMVRGHRELLHRALENVVRNAVKYAPAGTAIEITASVDSYHSRVTVEVSDRGPGVPDAHLASIFEPFFRARSADGTSGYGLGLALTRRVIIAHGGAIAAANRNEDGLQVSIRLPTAA